MFTLLVYHLLHSLYDDGSSFRDSGQQTTSQEESVTIANQCFDGSCVVLRHNFVKIRHRYEY